MKPGSQSGTYKIVTLLPRVDPEVTGKLDWVILNFAIDPTVEYFRNHIFCCDSCALMSNCQRTVLEIPPIHTNQKVLTCKVKKRQENCKNKKKKRETFFSLNLTQIYFKISIVNPNMPINFLRLFARDKKIKHIEKIKF